MVLEKLQATVYENLSRTWCESGRQYKLSDAVLVFERYPRLRKSLVPVRSGEYETS